jgi:signal transduction histidine kinase
VTGIRARFALLVATAAVAPLLIYGVVSIKSLRDGTKESVAAGNSAVAAQVAYRIGQYFESNGRVLRSLGQELNGTQLATWQQLRIVRNYVLEFPEFKEIGIFDESGTRLLSSRATNSQLELPADRPAAADIIITPVELDEDSLPTSHIAVPFEPAAGSRRWVVAEISLETLWRAVDDIRIGQQGFAMIVDGTGRVVAHGNPDQKRLIASGDRSSPVAEAMRNAGQDDSPRFRRVSTDAGDLVVVAATIANPAWTVMIEQPVAEAFAVTHRLERQLLLAIGIALLATVVAGSWWGRAFIRRIFALTTVTDALAAGRMDARVHLDGRDEIAQLGTQFNAMADQLVKLQDDIRKQERQAMFGRVAAGLVHDLSHPIQTINASCKLIQRMFDDHAYRLTFQETVERELTTVKRVLDDLRNIARPTPLVRFPIDLNAALAEVVQSMSLEAQTAGVDLRAELSREAAWIEADPFALGRVHRNLIVNAIQATEPGGQVVVTSDVRPDTVAIAVRDTGCGIAPERLHAVFEDFVTTKGRGLGLGLAISKKLVDQLGGRIRVASDVGKGTSFTLEFPRTAARPAARAAG